MERLLDGERIPLGRFTCDQTEKSGGSAEITLADRLYFSDKTYVPKVKLPAWSKAVEDDICKQLGLQNGNDYTTPAKLRVKGGARLYGKGHIRLKTANFDFKISSIPKDTTMRQMLSYIASAQGEFGFVDRYGRYVRKWYGSSVKILDNNTIDRQHWENVRISSQALSARSATAKLCGWATPQARQGVCWSLKIRI